jgi:hypothetical protein
MTSPPSETVPTMSRKQPPLGVPKAADAEKAYGPKVRWTVSTGYPVLGAAAGQPLSS